uniref:Granulins domain-containing protein n=1 Tax=Haplochromis burtoni TaxID=8153 RepID=A0A3Q2VZV4_HAPBU
MSRLTLWLSVGVFVWGFASCSITCPDGSTCSDISTCCKTEYGYGCCQYPKVSQSARASAVSHHDESIPGQLLIFATLHPLALCSFPRGFQKYCCSLDGQVK